MSISDIAVPDIIEQLSFDDIKSELIELLKTKIPSYEPLESDPYMAVIEAVAYREMVLRARINNAIKATLLPTATGADLDNVVAIYNVERQEGMKPQASIELALSTKRPQDVTIPQGTVFTDTRRTHFVRLIESVLIESGETKREAAIELEEYTTDSTAKMDAVVTPLPFVVIVKQLTSFTGGYGKEGDDALRERAPQSLERYSTAGSKESYKYHALSASPAVRAVYVDSVVPGRVRVVIQVLGDEDTRTRALNAAIVALSDETVRPVTDNIDLVLADRQIYCISAVIEVFDMLNAASIIAKIENDFNSKVWDLGEDLNLSYIYKTMHTDGVYRVRLESPLTDVKVDNGEFIELELSITAAEAVL